MLSLTPSCPSSSSPMGRKPLQGEKRLLLAMLEDAVTVSRPISLARKPHERRLFQRPKNGSTPQTRTGISRSRISARSWVFILVAPRCSEAMEKLSKSCSIPTEQAFVVSGERQRIRPGAYLVLVVLAVFNPLGALWFHRGYGVFRLPLAGPLGGLFPAYPACLVVPLKEWVVLFAWDLS